MKIHLTAAVFFTIALSAAVSHIFSYVCIIYYNTCYIQYINWLNVIITIIISGNYNYSRTIYSYNIFIHLTGELGLCSTSGRVVEHTSGRLGNTSNASHHVIVEYVL